MDYHARMSARLLASAIAAAFAACACADAAAQIYRCRAPGGAVTYQEIPCAEGDGRALDIPTAYPEPDRAGRDRLLRREAELDARLLRRAEIDARVQIAREERLAREAELRRQAAADAPSGVILLQPFAAAHGAPYRGHRRGPPRFTRWF